jgi:hypothetical protein
MKKVIISAFALALPALASAQVQLMSGFNFGQFLGAGAPSVDATTFDTIGSVGANYRLGSIAPASSGGGFVGTNSLPGNYSVAGGGRAYWDGTNGSTAYDFTSGVQIVSVNTGPNAVNGLTVQGYTMAFAGDDIGQGLGTNQANGRISFAGIDTSGFLDYTPGSPLHSNLTFAAAAASTPVTVNWYVNGSGVSFGSTVISGGLASYTVDLPSGFYGLASAQLVGEFSGSALLDNVQFNGLNAIPEPSTYAAIIGFATLGVVALRRRKAALSLS